VWRDWVLVGPMVPVAVVEVVFRNDLGWPPVAFVFGVVSAFMLLWRRTHPLAAVAVAFGLHGASEAVTLLGAEHQAMLYSSALLLVLPYSLFRWAAGRDCAIGLAIIMFVHVPHGPVAWSTVVETAVGILVLLFPAVLGAAIRYRATSKVRELDQVKLREREQLARELHDTVAHHVSAIIIQAQAGRTVAPTDPAAAVHVLEVIEAEASRTLSEMRTMVGALRRGEDPDLAPQRGVADIERLAAGVGEGPRVDVHLSGGLTDLQPSVGAAIYRLAQESITNAIRHARHATRIDVSVAGDNDSVRLTVRDDGDHSPFNAKSTSGYGLVGMAERAHLLGGSLEAGPGPDRGWTITAVLPRNGVPA
jgi:signal transduction histidine kinase